MIHGQRSRLEHCPDNLTWSHTHAEQVGDLIPGFWNSDDLYENPVKLIASGQGKKGEQN